MRLMIDLHDEVYNNMVVKNEYTDMDVIAVHNALMGAIRISEGHGRLIDADALKYLCEFEECISQTGIGCNHCQYHTITEYEIDNSPTIIAADTTRDCKTCGHSNGGKCAYTEECHECMLESKYIEVDKESKTK